MCGSAQCGVRCAAAQCGVRVFTILHTLVSGVFVWFCVFSSVFTYFSQFFFLIFRAFYYQHKNKGVRNFLLLWDSTVVLYIIIQYSGQHFLSLVRFYMGLLLRVIM